MEIQNTIQSTFLFIIPHGNKKHDQFVDILQFLREYKTPFCTKLPWPALCLPYMAESQYHSVEFECKPQFWAQFYWINWYMEK